MDPACEPAHRHLMELFERIGRRSDALRQYQFLTEALDRELSTEPSAETRDVYERIRGGSAALTQTHQSPGGAAVPRCMSCPRLRCFPSTISPAPTTATSSTECRRHHHGPFTLQHADGDFARLDLCVSGPRSVRPRRGGGARRAVSRSWQRATGGQPRAHQCPAPRSPRRGRPCGRTVSIARSRTSSSFKTSSRRRSCRPWPDGSRRPGSPKPGARHQSAWMPTTTCFAARSIITGTPARIAEPPSTCSSTRSEAIPEYATAHAWLACGLGQAMGFRPDEYDALLDQAQLAAERGLELDPSDSECLRILAQISLMRRNLQRAIRYQEQGLFLNPNDDRSVCAMGEILSFAGRCEEAEGWVRKAMRLNPYHPPRYWSHLARALFHQGRHREALDALQNIRAPRVRERGFQVAAASALGDAERDRQERRCASRGRSGFRPRTLRPAAPVRRRTRSQGAARCAAWLPADVLRTSRARRRDGIRAPEASSGGAVHDGARRAAVVVSSDQRVGRVLPSFGTPSAEAWFEKAKRRIRVSGTRGRKHWLRSKRSCRSVREDAALSFSGRIAAQMDCLRMAGQHLLIEQAIRETPEILDTQIPPPIFLIGWMRTGTTFVHRLLAQDPDTRTMPYWESMYPVPPAGGKDDRAEELARVLKQLEASRRTTRPFIRWARTSRRSASRSSPTCSGRFSTTFSTVCLATSSGCRGKTLASRTVSTGSSCSWFSTTGRTALGLRSRIRPTRCSSTRFSSSSPTRASCSPIGTLPRR